MSATSLHLVAQYTASLAVLAFITGVLSGVMKYCLLIGCQAFWLASYASLWRSPHMYKSDVAYVKDV